MHDMVRPNSMHTAVERRIPSVFYLHMRIIRERTNERTNERASFGRIFRPGRISEGEEGFIILAVGKPCQRNVRERPGELDV